MRASAFGLCFIIGCALVPACTCADPPSKCEPDGSCAPFVLSAPVEIVRDADGVVHVYGKTDADVFYASGYMQAVDRLFQMDLMRRQVYGRRAEVLGDGFVGDDELIRKLDVARWGKEHSADIRQNQPQSFELVLAWVAGINAVSYTHLTLPTNREV